MSPTQKIWEPDCSIKKYFFLFSIDKIEDDEEDITDTEETDYTNIEVTKLDIIDGLNSSQAKPANLNEDPVLKREAEKKKEKEAEKKLRTSVSSIGRTS